MYTHICRYTYTHKHKYTCTHTYTYDTDHIVAIANMWVIRDVIKGSPDFMLVDIFMCAWVCVSICVWVCARVCEFEYLCVSVCEWVCVWVSVSLYVCGWCVSVCIKKGRNVLCVWMCIYIYIATCVQAHRLALNIYTHARISFTNWMDTDGKNIYTYISSCCSMNKAWSDNIYDTSYILRQYIWYIARIITWCFIPTTTFSLF